MSQHINVLQFRAKIGEEDAVVALHEDWQRSLLPRVKGYLRGELLNQPEDPRSFLSVVRYVSAAACQTAESDPEQSSWYQRLLSLIEGDPVAYTCRCAWSTDGPPGLADWPSAP